MNRGGILLAWAALAVFTAGGWVLLEYRRSALFPKRGTFRMNCRADPRALRCFLRND